MRAEEAVCQKCGANAMQAAERGAYLKRVNKKGKGIKAINECAPSCEHKSGDQNDALVHAVLGN